MKSRIIERTLANGDVSYIIQQRHFLFRRMWVDAWVNSLFGAACRDSFSTIDRAKENLCFFDETKIKERVVINNELDQDNE